MSRVSIFFPKIPNKTKEKKKKKYFQPPHQINQSYGRFLKILF